MADKQDPEAAWIAAVRGASESDVAHYTAASGWLDMAVARSEAAGDEAARAFAHAFQGRLGLLLMDLEGTVPTGSAQANWLKNSLIAWVSSENAQRSVILPSSSM